MMISTSNAPRLPALGPLCLAALLAITVLSGCGGDKKDKPATQTAARVNKEEITVHQINHMLQQQRGLRPEQTDAVSAQVLERLIDQELALQKAQELKLDRDARVVQQIEATRREIIARAYAEKVSEAAAKPTPEDVKKYYDSKPALFSERRIYNLQEIVVEAKADQLDVIKGKLQEAKNIAEFVEFLKAGSFKFAGNQAVRPAEQLPLSMLDTIAKLKDGQAMVLPSPNGAQVVFLAGSRSEPVSAEKARPVIEQYLLNDARRKLVDADLKSLRATAKVEYLGKYAAGAASAAAAASTAPTAPAAPAASGNDAAAISKGISGLK